MYDYSMGIGAAEEQLKFLAERLGGIKCPDELKERINVRLSQLGRLTDSPSFLPELDRISRYIEWVISLPWYNQTEDNLDLVHARKILDKNHHGLDDIKERILEYISVMKLKREKGENESMMRAPALCFVGLVGTGKTTSF